jgi:hypothetical protein
LLYLNVIWNVGVIVDKPLHAALEPGQAVDDVLFESFDGQQRN